MNSATSKSVLEDANLMEETEYPTEAPPAESWADFEEQRPVSRRRYWVLAALLAGLAAAGFTTWRLLAKPAAATYGVAAIERGNIVKTITATGNVQPVTTVQVGTQVSGTVSELHADFNDYVHAGQVIARLDPAQFQAQYNQASANLESARAQVTATRSSIVNADAAVASAKANIDRMDSAMADAQRNYDLTKQLVAAGISASSQLDTAQATLAQAVAQKAQAVAQWNQAKAQAQSVVAQLEQAQAGVRQAEAAVASAKVNLDRTVIRAPIDGVVIARNVDIGQTVAASLQAPTLFLIANDVKKMQVYAAIDEADVGQLRPGSKATFTVDAFPTDTFQGTIREVRLAPQTVQNVVTYTAIIDVDNPELKLKPGMTANVTVAVADHENVLTIPNSALRFRPENVTAPAAPRPGGAASGTRAARTSHAVTVWKVEGATLAPVKVRLGMTDGVSTEILSGGLAAGDQVATPAQLQASAAASGSRSASPFAGAGRGGRR
jgi:HlyD family secretion protein